VSTLRRSTNANGEQRINAIKRWVEYIKSEPPKKWGPQQNAVVDGQLEAAQSVQHSASHQQHVIDVAIAVRKVNKRSDTDSE